MERNKNTQKTIHVPYAPYSLVQIFRCTSGYGPGGKQFSKKGKKYERGFLLRQTIKKI
jgi:hypothetical protein